MASSAMPPPPIAQVTAPLLIGALINYFLFGILTLQLYVYSCSFPYDKTSIKLLIYIVYALELVQICCAGADAYYWLCLGFGDPNHLNNTYISPFDTPMIGSIVAFIVQLFFCHRIWKLRANNWYIIMCAMIGAVSIVQLVGGVVGGVQAHRNKYFSVISDSSLYALMWLAGEAVSDFLIATTMSYLLVGSDPERRANTNVVNRAVRLIVQSNSLTASTAIVAAIMFAALPGKNYFITPTMVLGKLYSNTLLATFNHRILLRWEASGPFSSNSDSSRHGVAPRLPYRSKGFSETVTENNIYGHDF
jgi:hypothetical protein